MNSAALIQLLHPVPSVFTLPRCQISLFEDAGDGVLGEELYTARNVESFKSAERLTQIEVTPTGIPHPEIHSMGEHHELSWDGVWNVAAKMKRGDAYILAVTWQDATIEKDERAWQRRYYQGVSCASRDITSRDGNEFTSSNALSAKWFVEAESEEGGPQTPVTPIPGTATC